MLLHDVVHEDHGDLTLDVALLLLQVLLPYTRYVRILNADGLRQIVNNPSCH